MKNKTLILILPLLLIGGFLFFASSCDKEDDNNNGQENVPVLSTTEVTEITQTTAISGGNITDDGGAEITARGVVWSTSQNPTVESNQGITTDGTGTGEFVSSLTGLYPNTTNYVRAYATNSAGTCYGQQENFTTTTAVTPGDGITDIDGNVYPTVIIGNQEWMAENLRVTRDANGNNILRYCYDNNNTNCELYGGLYSWEAVMNGQSSSNSNPSGVQGICPDGWHVPSYAQWKQLVDYVVAQGFPNSDVTNGASNALKSCRQVNSPLGGDCNTTQHPRWDAHNSHHGFDEFGFSGLPGGARGGSGNFKYIGKNGYWWSSTEAITPIAEFRFLVYDDGLVKYGLGSKSSGYTVRCLRD